MAAKSSRLPKPHDPLPESGEDAVWSARASSGHRDSDANNRAIEPVVNLKRLRLLTIVGPLAFLLVVEVISIAVLTQALGNHALLRLLVIFGILTLAAIPFSCWVFSVIERQQQQVSEDMAQRRQAEEHIRDLNAELERRVDELNAVNQAITSVSLALDLSHVLQSIADAARELVHARYAALGVTDERGRIVEFITSGITPEQQAAIGPLPQGHGLLGALIKEGTPLRIADISRDARRHGFPANHPPMTSLLGVPILFQGMPVGDLYLTDKLGPETFTQDDQDVLILLANHAAVAIQNARLFEEVRQTRDRLQTWNDELETRVAERTREIERYSKELNSRVLQAQEAERKRIARELHDDTAQSLSTLLINLDVIEPFVPEDNAVLLGGFERVRGLVKRTLDEVRALSHDLRPTILDDFGLVAALHWYAEQFSETFKTPVTVKAEKLSENTLSGDMELALFRIAQEGLMNLGKYAEATHAWVRLFTQDETVTLIVEDNGRGFDVEAVQRPTPHGGLGLHGMHERADLIGATLTVESTLNVGTRITVVIPQQQ